MGTNNFTLILLLEALFVCLFVTSLLLIKNRQLSKLIKKLKTRIAEMSQKTPTSDSSAPSAASIAEISYSERLNQQLETTKDYHFSLGSRQDIALDLDPDAPLSRRTAALRHAFLIAEKEATRIPEETNWDFLSSRYQQLLSYNEDYANEPDTGLKEDLAQAKIDIENAKKRINNLERFKTMYFELEARWEKCKQQANEYYSDLTTMASKAERPDDFRSTLDQYHASYSEIGATISKSLKDLPDPEFETSSESQLHEIRRLRSVAAEQHAIIGELQIKLEASTSTEEQTTIVSSLKAELNKQARYMQESETCIQLMEDELAAANRELEQLRNRVSQLTMLKTQIKELQDGALNNEQIVASLKQENRRLAKKLKLTQSAPPEDNPENRALRKEVAMLQSKYNDLEEKFLNLKLKG
jgi:predicted DNA-binding ArsR family transcriptional regulator